MNPPDEHSDRNETAFERLLDRLQPFGSDLSNGLTSHAPMVVEALLSLGRIDAADAWLERYLVHAIPRAAQAAPLPDDGWQDALGRPELEGRWCARFECDIAERGWRATLARWTERLAPGFAGAAAHGVIRTAHAARALGRADSGPRRAELAAGLALWGSSWQTLPGDPLAASGNRRAADALRAIPIVPTERRRNRGAITTALEVLAGERDFAPALGGLDRDRPFDVLAYDLAWACAGNFLVQVHTPLQAIVFTHSITGVAAACRLAPGVAATTAGNLLAYAWQTGAALQACYAEPTARGPADATPAVARAVGDLATAAVAHGDEHVIKLAEACIEFHAVSRDPIFLAAARRALETIPPG